MCRLHLQVVDAVLCDPPYGVRAGGRKSVYRDTLVRENHTPHTDPYTLTECTRDLLDLAARLLVIGVSLQGFTGAMTDRVCIPGCCSMSPQS